MINDELSEAVEAFEGRDNGLGQRPVEVQCQLLDLCALAEQLDQRFGDCASGDGRRGERVVLVGLGGDGELSDVAMVGMRYVSDIGLHSLKTIQIQDLYVMS